MPTEKSFFDKIAPIAGGVASFVPEIFKFFTGQKQINQANKINPVNPGFQANNSLIDNARMLEERYRNYQVPGSQQARQSIAGNAATAFNNGLQGASSSGDVLDLASKVQYGAGQQYNQLGAQSAQGADQALNQYLQANAMAGNESVRKNMFDLDQYNQRLQEKAALLQAGNQNRFGAGDNIADGIRYFTQPQQQLVQPGSKNGSTTPYGSIFS